MRQLLDKIGYVPRRGVWELTLRCNLRCLHCGSRAGGTRGDELTDEETYSVVDQLAALGMKSCTLSGGEPLLRENWAQIAERFSKKGVRVNMISNGLKADRETVRRMKSAGMSNVGVSIDGHEESHDFVRGRSGSWRAAMHALENWRKAWMLKDLDGYFSAYVPDFRGESKSTEGWRRWREERIRAASDLDLRLSDAQFDVLGPDRVKVDFRQEFRAAHLHADNRKTIVFVFDDGRWLIEEERVQR